MKTILTEDGEECGLHTIKKKGPKVVHRLNTMGECNNHFEDCNIYYTKLSYKGMEENNGK